MRIGGWEKAEYVLSMLSFVFVMGFTLFALEQNAIFDSLISFDYLFAVPIFFLVASIAYALIRDFIALRIRSSAQTLMGGNLRETKELANICVRALISILVAFGFHVVDGSYCNERTVNGNCH